MLTKQEQSRYNRHIILPEVGEKGQLKLKQAKVLVIGAGGLGCPILQYLTAAGVGTIGIIDNDIVSLSNLQRQILYSENDINKPKVEVAKQKLSVQNPNITFNTYNDALHNNNALKIIKEYDIIVDGSDNFPTRYLVNDACVILNKPLVFGSIYKFEGQVSVFNFNNGPTYRCLYPTPPTPEEVPNCSEIGVIGVLPGLIGTIQANEVIKLIIGIGKPLSGQLLLLNALTMQQSILKFDPTPINKQITELTDYEYFCGTKAEDKHEVSVEEFSNWKKTNSVFEIIDVREKREFEYCNLGGQNIPLGLLPHHFSNLPENKKIVLICHHGNRSIKALRFLESVNDKLNLYNLTGGLHEWALKIDPNFPKY